MSRKSSANTPESIRRSLVSLLENFESKLEEEDLRDQVRGLIPARDMIQDLGSSLVDKGSARARILEYFKRYPKQVIEGEELAVVAGISEWARRVRELRVEHGWSIVSGRTANEMAEQGEFPLEDLDVSEMAPGDYILLDTEQDREAAHRWNVANEIRNRTALSMKDRMLEYLRQNVGREVTGEELRYVGRGSTWARRIRELRTEDGWPVSTHYSGRPDLPPGVYVLEEDEQLPEHDRDVNERVRRRVLRRDDHECQDCGWTHAKHWNPSDPRHLEVHHEHPHSEGGSNDPENLVTLCDVCHDERHASD